MTTMVVCGGAQVDLGWTGKPQHNRVQKTKSVGKKGCIEGSASVTTVSGSIGSQRFRFRTA